MFIRVGAGLGSGFPPPDRRLRLRLVLPGRRLCCRGQMWADRTALRIPAIEQRALRGPLLQESKRFLHRPVMLLDKQGYSGGESDLARIISDAKRCGIHTL